MPLPGIEWSPSEAAAVNDFLNTPVGRKWMGVLLTRKPRVDLSAGTERAAMTGAYSAGYESFFAEIAATRFAATGEIAGVKSIDPTRD
jgi:hypothetical protein